jgi:hypothetical protein
MVMEFYGVTQRQCEMVTNSYKDTELANQLPPILDCCPDMTTDGTTNVGCYLTGFPESVFNMTKAPHFTYSLQQRTPRVIPWSVPPSEPFQDNIVNEICQNRPFIFAGQALDDNGLPEDAYHVGVVIRYQNVPSATDPAIKEKSVGIVDPYDGYKDMSYTDIKADKYFVYYSDYTHILPTGGGQ